MIFNFSKDSYTQRTFMHKLVRGNRSTQTRSGVSLFLYDDSDRIEALLTEDLIESIRIQRDNHVELRSITVPKNAFTDFASCPRILWNIFAPIGKHTKAAIIHDYLYTTKEVTRKEADYAFRELMRECQVGCIKRWIMWASVRLFGGGHW